MRLVCPGCGLTASGEAWVNDPAARDLLAAVAQLSPPLPPVVLGYLSLFRPESRALSWKKALRLVMELAKLTGSGYVQVQGRVSRPCPPRIWAQAMESMVDRRDRFNGALKNHNYLRQVAYDLADTADAKEERARDAGLQNQHSRPGGDPEEFDWSSLTQKEIDLLPKHIREKHNLGDTDADQG